MDSKQRELKIGAIYQHYRGMRYKVHAIVRHSETLEELVYYEALYDNEIGKLWVRPKEMFLDSINIDGKQVARFSELVDVTV
jgi:hypothetical protein